MEAGRGPNPVRVFYPTGRPAIPLGSPGGTQNPAGIWAPRTGADVPVGPFKVPALRLSAERLLTAGLTLLWHHHGISEG